MYKTLRLNEFVNCKFTYLVGMKVLQIAFVVLTSCLFTLNVTAQDTSKFKQLQEELPTPNQYRNGSGAPGVQYWQQRVDYDIDVQIDDDLQQLKAKESICYHNNSPDELRYLWIQLDQNVREANSVTNQVRKYRLREKMFSSEIQRLHNDYDGGFKITSVTNKENEKMTYSINYTMMRLELDAPLKSGDSCVFNIEWWYNVNNARVIRGRGGYEYFEEDDNRIYEIAQWFPRLAVYDDANGWQNKQFLGRGEFALEFGNYNVNITVPADHVVAATGSLLNPDEVLTEEQRSRLEQARTSGELAIIVNQTEVEANEQKGKSTQTKTWKFKADSVRDFAFANSRKFIWDAMGVDINGKIVMAMSYYPKEGNPLWEEVSTKAVASALTVYSRHTIDYPYPAASSVNGPIGGMEYPMISFNGARPNKDGSYSEGRKRALISVVIHEVGHNFFPMIINSDERQWTWMDEGLNTFVQSITQREWPEEFHSRYGAPKNITKYMGGDKSEISPIMTNSESIFQFGANAYAKPATALNILRSTIMGEELFDYAFKEYARRWAFKHPEPADFFRTMEDASAFDLDWFWRGWFYSTDHVDLELSSVEWYEFDSKNLDLEVPEIENKSVDLSKSERMLLKEWEKDKMEFSLRKTEKENYQKYYQGLSNTEKYNMAENYYVYKLHVNNIGGLIMPVLVQALYADGSEEIRKIPVETWLKSEAKTQVYFKSTVPVLQFIIDPENNTADTDMSNNSYPKQEVLSKFQDFKKKAEGEE